MADQEDAQAAALRDHSRLERFLLLSLLAVIAYTLAAYLVLPAFWTHYEHQKGLATLPMVTLTAQYSRRTRSMSAWSAMKRMFSAPCKPPPGIGPIR